MRTYTVIAYDAPCGAHRVECIEADSPTEAAQKLSQQHAIIQTDIEIIGVVEGEMQFCSLDHTKLNLASFAA